MPYRRKRKTSRSRVPRVRTSRPLTRTLGFRNAVKAVVNRQAETLHHRVDVTDSVFSIGFLTELNTVDSQGVQSGQFTGSEITQQFISVRGKVQQADASNIVRMVVFTPSQQGLEQLKNGDDLSDLFYNPPRAIYSAWRPSLVDKIYKDKLMVLNASTGQNDAIRMIRINQRLGGKKYRFMEGAAAGTTTGSNVIYLGFISDSDVSFHPACEFESILYYKDS